MHSSFTTRLVSTVCFLIFTLTVYCIPRFEVFSFYKLKVFFPEAQAAEAQEENQAEPQEKNQIEAPDTTETPPSPETLTTSVATFEAGDEMGVGLGINIPLLENSLFTGAATSKIPIVVPPGRGAMTPNIYLMYNSRQGAGWVGVGWNLDMGAIQRSTKWGLNYGVNDFVAVMNGSYNELIQRSDWGTNYFGSKIEGAFSKYYLNPSTTGWEVTAKDGTKYYYGTTSASRQDNASGVFKWCLDKVQDTNGNYMTLTYWKDQGEIYLDRIDYTGNGSLLPTNYVKFYRESRTDAPPMYTIKSLVKTAYRLKTIEVYGNGQLARKYVINYTYSTSTRRSKLSSVTLYGNDGTTALPDIGIGWSEASGFEDKGTWISGAYGWWWNVPDRIRNADVNGDGKSDIVLGPAWDGKWYVMLSTGSSFEDKGLWLSGAYESWTDKSDRIRNVDLNGDGKSDIVLGPDLNGKWYVMLSTGTSFDNKGAWISWVYASWTDKADRIRNADVNGDGKADIILGPDTNGKWYVMLSTGTSFENKGAWISWVYASWTDKSDRIRIADVNGDGKSDIILGPDANGKWYVMLSTGTSFENKGAWISWVYASWTDEADRIRIADVNGDGKSDIILGPDANGKWYPNPDIKKRLASGREDLEAFSGRRALVCLKCEIHRHRFNGMLINLPMRGVYESRYQETPIMGQAL